LPPLGHQRDTAGHDLGGLHAADGLAVELDHLARRIALAGDGGHERRLARAIGADDGDGLALVDMQVDPVERLEIAVEGGKPVGRQKPHASSPR
jgi:hypothetical protein